MLSGSEGTGRRKAGLPHLGPLAPARSDSASAKKFHPDSDPHVTRSLGVSIAWKNVAYQLGGWADWECDDAHFDRLLKPEGRFWVAGDQVSYLSGSQEGAVRSAHHVIEGITKQTPYPQAAIRR